MRILKKSLGQNFLVDKNIINKIINLIEVKNKNILEIGPGNGALSDQILKKKPKSLILIEKDFFFLKTTNPFYIVLFQNYLIQKYLSYLFEESLTLKSLYY